MKYLKFQILDHQIPKEKFEDLERHIHQEVRLIAMSALDLGDHVRREAGRRREGAGICGLGSMPSRDA